jgi:hypothetical protein
VHGIVRLGRKDNLPFLFLTLTLQKAGFQEFIRSEIEVRTSRECLPHKFTHYPCGLRNYDKGTVIGLHATMRLGMQFL